MANISELSCSARAESDLSSGSGEESDSSTVPLGIAIGLLASVGINLGQNIQSSHKTPYPTGFGGRHRLFWFGTGMFVLSAIANFVAFAFAPASVLAPLEGAQFVTNFAYGVFTKSTALYDKGKGWKRKAVGRTSGGTALVVLGIVLPILTASNEVAVFNEEAIWCFWRNTTWWIYFVITSVVGVSFFVTWRMIRSSVNAGDHGHNQHNKLHMVLFAVPAAVMGGFAVVQAKAISELVEPIFSDGQWSVLGSFLFWQCLFFIGIGLGTWIYAQQRATDDDMYEVLAILPLMQGCYIIFSSIGGGIFFEEFDSFSTSQAVTFAAGLVFIVIGMWFILPMDVPNDGEGRALAHTKQPCDFVVRGFLMPVILFPVVVFTTTVQTEEANVPMPGLFIAGV